MPPDLRLIVITDPGLASPRTIEEVVEAALEAGAPAIQLRDKAATPAALYQQAIELRDLTRRYGALLFINDRVDVALAAEADGVHLGPQDLPVAAARKAARAAFRNGPAHDDFVIGASTDDPDTARRLERAGADYIGCGAVFGTSSKADVGDERIGPQGLAAVVEALRIPVVAIGGITTDNVHRIPSTGAHGVAVISSLMTAQSVSATTRTLLSPFTRSPTQ